MPPCENESPLGRNRVPLRKGGKNAERRGGLSHEARKHREVGGTLQDAMR
jgi:hypothetical protein